MWKGVIFLCLFFRRISFQSGGVESCILNAVNKEPEYVYQHAVKNDFPTAAVDGIYTIDTADDGCQIRKLCFVGRNAFRFLQIGNGSHGKKIRDEIDHNGEIN